MNLKCLSTKTMRLHSNVWLHDSDLRRAIMAPLRRDIAVASRVRGDKSETPDADAGADADTDAIADADMDTDAAADADAAAVTQMRG